LNYQLKNEVSQANFNTYKRIYNWQPFTKRVYYGGCYQSLDFLLCLRSSVGQSESLELVIYFSKALDFLYRPSFEILRNSATLNDTQFQAKATDLFNLCSGLRQFLGVSLGGHYMALVLQRAYRQGTYHFLSYNELEV